MAIGRILSVNSEPGIVPFYELAGLLRGWQLDTELSGASAASLSTRRFFCRRLTTLLMDAGVRSSEMCGINRGDA